MRILLMLYSVYPGFISKLKNGNVEDVRMMLLAVAFITDVHVTRMSTTQAN